MEKENITMIGNSTNQKSLSATVFRKSTHTDKYLEFRSHNPLAHKVAVARILFDLAEICSDVPDLEKEKEHVEQVLQNNSYPRGLVTKNWHPPPRSQLPEQDPPQPQSPYRVSVIYLRPSEGYWPH